MSPASSILPFRSTPTPLLSQLSVFSVYLLLAQPLSGFIRDTPNGAPVEKEEEKEEVKE